VTCENKKLKKIIHFASIKKEGEMNAQVRIFSVGECIHWYANACA